MSLELVNDLFNNLKENKFVQNFIKELSNYLKNNLNFNNEEIPIIEDILSKNKFTTGNQNSIRWNLDDVVLKYSQTNSVNDALYFVKEKRENSYIILEAKDGKIEEIEINKKDISSEVKVNDVLKFQNNNFIVDNYSTNELKIWQKKYLINKT